MNQVRVIEVKQSVFADNDKRAAALCFSAAALLVILLI